MLCDVLFHWPHISFRLWRLRSWWSRCRRRSEPTCPKRRLRSWRRLWRQQGALWLWSRSTQHHAVHPLHYCLCFFVVLLFFFLHNKPSWNESWEVKSLGVWTLRLNSSRPLACVLSHHPDITPVCLCLSVCSVTDGIGLSVCLMQWWRVSWTRSDVCHLFVVK